MSLIIHTHTILSPLNHQSPTSNNIRGTLERQALEGVALVHSSQPQVFLAPTKKHSPRRGPLRLHQVTQDGSSGDPI